MEDSMGDRAKKSIKQLVVEIHQRMDEVVIPTIHDHEQRIRTAEKGLWWAGGIASVVGIVVGIVLHFIKT